MSVSQWRRLATFLGIVLLLAALLAIYRSRHEAGAPPGRVPVTILAINDFHGNLKPPLGGISIADPKDNTKKISVPAGGAEHMATLVKQLRAGKKNSVFVAAGDLIGASPLLRPCSTTSHGRIPVADGPRHRRRRQPRVRRGPGRAAAHAERRLPPRGRLQGAAQVRRCQLPLSLRQHLRKGHGQDAVPGLRVEEFEGIPVAFIGLTLRGTPGMVSPSGVAGSTSATRPRASTPWCRSCGSMASRPSSC